MNKHKKKCEHLKQIRKNMADALGVDLKQRECTFEGDCKGTCPKCEQEENLLKKALLKGSAVVATTAIVFTGCATEPEDDIAGGMSVYEEDKIDLNLEGDFLISPENVQTEDLNDEILVGELEEEIPEIEYPVLEGDVAIMEE